MPKSGYIIKVDMCVQREKTTVQQGYRDVIDS
jgi:hypothetical protein